MTPELSIIVPILNENEQLRCLLTDLVRQRDVDFEVILSDGGSSDDPAAVVSEYARFCGFRVSLLVGAKGRGRQLNAGILKANAGWLLLLHVDSRFYDDRALRNALDQMKDHKRNLVAGRFPLRFRYRSHHAATPGFYYYEWKARLPRRECIHGDQGFMLSRETFQRVGHFRENLPVMEDTDFAERLRRIGRWELLTSEISTSARRFETEGLWQRQLLNALIMCFRSIGWEEFFAQAISVYRQQGVSGTLRMRPFFRQVRRSMLGLPFGQRMKVWYRSGSYVQGHAWQLAFALDAKREFKKGVPPGQGKMTWVKIFEPIYNLLTNHPPGRLAATVLLWIWFYSTWFWLLFVERRIRINKITSV
ncbi:TIGR04283 family arsenosugar biosynthesis glycosyltransferase [Geopsychrobacter electrodiphilus]|uniref:TIGR04283 family arsenosugar biosynthesis glycosyltransferase n=1 Tax=Geopsychrobacter electrodiphilus TaxID=225196 RepID=UPI00037C64AC|nr:TIGR04283 family arsenosugar biosynthesis glycosyltransferase [Geopsychrobacter electrodiphilus]